jgi:hypothetical protein
MQISAKKIVQGVLLAGFIAAGIRLVLTYRERNGPELKMTAVRGVDTGLSPEAYVVPKRLHAYDLKSLQVLAGKPVWVQEGYRYTVYPVAGVVVDFGHEAGMLGPIEKVEIQALRKVSAPTPGQQQVVAIFKKDGKQLALPLGTARGNDYHIYADEVLFYEDPHELYKQWPPEIWQAIAQHQMKPGMNEYQAVFALGMGTPQPSYDAAVKTVVYPNGGKPVTVTYRSGKAVEIDASR